MKKLAIFFLFIIDPLISFSQSKEWEVVHSVPIPYTIYIDLACSDSLNCIALGMTYNFAPYYFERTTDGGKTWKIVFVDSTINQPAGIVTPSINSMNYFNNKLFMALGDSGVIYRTTDNGETWNKRIFDKELELFNLNSFGDSYAIMCGNRIDGNKDGGKLYRSMDAGINWIRMKTPKEYWNIAIEDLQIINENLFVMLVFFWETKKTEIVWVVNDWEEYWAYPRNKHTHYLHFADENKGWLSGGTKVDVYNYTQLIEYTEDGGKTWIAQRDTFVNSFPCDYIDFYDEKHGMVTASEGLMLVTDNGGKTWRTDSLVTVPNGGFYPLFNVQFPSITTAFCIGSTKNIHKYTRDWSVVAEEQENEGYNVSLYPNPAAEMLNISLTKDMYGEAEVSLIDIHGRTISSFKTREFTSSIDVSGLPPGVYGVIARFGKNVVGKRVSVVR